MKRKFYGRAVRNSWIVSAAGIMSIFAGFNLADIRDEMGYYSLVMIGLLLFITGIVVALLFMGYEKSAGKILNSPAPLLHFTARADEYGSFAEAEAAEIKSLNRSSLMIALFFCALIAVGGPILVREDGYLFTIISAGIALFLIAAEGIITRYRVKKIGKGDKEVILTEDGAFVDGQLHLWSVPLSFLSEVRYFKPGEYEGLEIGVIRIEYSAVTGTIVTPYEFIIPVPPGREDQAEAAFEALQLSARKQMTFGNISRPRE